MKKTFKVLGYVLAGIVLLLLILAAYVQIKGIPSYEVNVPEQYAVSSDSLSIANGKRLVNLICTDCHLNNENGLLEGKKMTDIPSLFGEVWSANLNNPKTGIGAYSNEELAYLLRTGIKKDGQYTPPWMVKLPNLADADLQDMLAFLRSDDPMLAASDKVQPACEPSFLVKALSQVVFKPFPYPEQEVPLPDPNDRLAKGAYLADAVVGCFSCHSADFTTNDDYTPTQSAGYYGGGTAMTDAADQTIYSANITMDTKTGIGSWTEEEFIKAVKWGGGPKYPIRAPMPKYTALSDEEIGAIFAYLKSVPVVENEVDRTRPVQETAKK